MLTLPIKRKWLDMIEAGEKKEEYRELSDYYDTRFANAEKFREDGKLQFWAILRAGYRKDSPKLAVICWLDIGEGKPEWGAEPGKEYFRLHITYSKRL